ncbi:MAG: hypothetical protein WC548_01900 [Candidatus Pacearchaeota archaeon]
MNPNFIKPYLPKQRSLIEIAESAPLRTSGGKPKKKETREETKIETEVELVNPAEISGDWIYVPSLNLSFSPERMHLGRNWNDTQVELEKQNLFMPTPYQFREFLKYLRDSKNPLYKEITEVRSPWRSNWINVKFQERKKELYMISEKVIEKGIRKNLSQKVTDYLTQNKTPGISLDSWLDSNNSHGLPSQNILDGNLYYWAPVSGSVARFFADSDWADFYCNGDPSDSYSSLGVYACAEGASAQKS